MKTPQTTQTPPESSSEIDFDLLDDLEPDPAQLDQEIAVSRALGTLPRGPSSADAAQPWTKDEMLAAGIPEPLHPLVGYYDSLEEAKAELAASGAKLNP